MNIFLLWACTSSKSDLDTAIETESEELHPSTMYVFTVDGEETVSYSGQIARHALISSLKSYMGNMSADIASGSYLPLSEEQVQQDLLFFVECPDFLCSDVSITGNDGFVQQVIGDISSNKNLIDKLAGNDSATDHKSWTGGDFTGWTDVGSPEGLLHSWFDVLAEQAFAQVNGNFAQSPDGDLLADVYLTPEGLDIQQLTQKFLLGAIAFSQGADDYLDNDIEGKGLLASHLIVEGQLYTDLEHAWDEGFGYFGAAQDYGFYTDQQLSDGENIDTNGDGLIDLKKEMNWGHSLNAGKRDLGAVQETDFTAQAWDHFLAGRQLLHDTRGEDLSSEDYDTLVGYRDGALEAWEKAIAATVIHYINDVVQDMSVLGEEEYSFANHAKHWSELKGFALSLQFNPHSPLSESDFVSFHILVGDAPVVSTHTQEEQQNYQTSLLEARTILGNAYGFAEANLGDEQGIGGW